MPSLYHRSIEPVVTESLETFRVVHLGGARQAGKTTLVHQLAATADAGSVVTFDDEAALASARNDPAGFLAALPRPLRIDEFQRAGEGLLLAVKAAADRDRRRGQILLTGSAGALTVGRSIDTLAGRVGRVVLWPFSQGEIAGTNECFIDQLGIPEAWPPQRAWRAPVRADVLEAVVQGGFPEVVTESLTGRRRVRWLDAYVEETIAREAVRPLVGRSPGPELYRFLRLVAARTAAPLVITDLAADAGVSRPTAARYLELLEALYLVHLQPAWATSDTTRAKRSPKLHLVDSGLTAAVLGLGERDLTSFQHERALGALLESFVVTELRKQAGWSERSVTIAHFQDRNGPEVDVIVEDRKTGVVAGIEVKATTTPRIEHARHLARLRDRLGDRFSVGVVLHLGTAVLPLGERLWAAPVPVLWTGS